MDELNELELEEQEDEELEGEEFAIELATIVSVGSTGVTIQIDGDEEASSKTYKVNSSALFAVGDRVKVHKNSGTYLVEYPVGNPMARYPIPTGGSDGQYLVKNGSANYSLKWASLTVHNVPSGGSANQVLMKNSAIDYDVKWATISGALPSGGSSGQYLRKKSNTNYDVEWAAQAHDLPTGGSNGQYLVKDGSTNYSVKWASAPATDRLTSGAKTVIYDGTYLYSGNSATLGSSSNYWNGCYIGGAIRLGNNSYNSTLGFFGSSPQSKKSVGSSGTLANLISALQSYGLIS